MCAALAWIELHPMRLPPLLRPSLTGLEYRRVTLDGSGVPLRGWHIPRPGSGRGLVLCHGHNNCRNQWFPMLRPLHEAGFHLLLFDFRAMGLSGGSVCTYGHQEHQDVAAGIRWLREEAGVDRLGIFGISMGGAAGLLAAAGDPAVGAVATDCTFASLADMVGRRLRLLPHPLREPLGQGVRFWAERWTGADVLEVDPESAVRSWQPRPLLVIHGENDTMVPWEHGRRLADAAGGHGELWLVRGAGHTACFRKCRDEYVARTVRFFSTHLSP
jgi:pimeloyl-ACP methyl ester carboxylesterase